MLKSDPPEQLPQATTPEQPIAHEHTVSEIVEASVKGVDEPMEREHPTSPGALVWFTFPAALILVLLVGLAILAFMQRS